MVLKIEIFDGLKILYILFIVCERDRVFNPDKKMSEEIVDDDVYQLKTLTDARVTSKCIWDFSESLKTLNSVIVLDALENLKDNLFSNGFVEDVKIVEDLILELNYHVLGGHDLHMYFENIAQIKCGLAKKHNFRKYSAELEYYGTADHPKRIGE